MVDPSSINSGNGGQIRIWSSIQTTIAGALKSVGGILGGNGGVIDTSSSGLVSILQTASINVSATLGKVGSWFIDANSINIDSGAAAVVSNTLANGNVFFNSKQNLTVASNAVIAPNSSNATILSLTSTGILTNNGAINATQNGALLLSASTIDLNANSSVSANQVTAVAQAIDIYGSVSGSGSNAILRLLGNVIMVAGRISVNSYSAGSSTGSSTSSTSSANNANSKKEEDAGTIIITAQNSLTTTNTATITADANAQNAGQVNLTVANGVANLAGLVSASSVSGIAGTITVAANDVSSSGSFLANGTTGGSIYVTSTSGNSSLSGTYSANGSSGKGGNFSAQSAQDLILVGTIAANGTDGGAIYLAANGGSITLNNAVQANGNLGAVSLLSFALFLIQSR